VEAKVAEAAQNPATGSDGYFFFENVLAAGAFNTLEDSQTTWTDTYKSDPGTYYVHVAGLDRPCFYADQCPVREFSQMKTVTIGSVVQPPPPVVTPPPPPVVTPPPPPVATPPPPTVDVVQCVVPRVIGKTVSGARVALFNANCSIGGIAKTYSKTKKGKVVAQSPKPRTRRAEGAKVRLLVSRGSRR